MATNDERNHDRPDTDDDIDPDDELAARRRRREQAAAELAAQIAEENADPVTRREAIEQGLEDEGLSDEGGTLGRHND
jgi:hypothetical protein